MIPHRSPLSAIRNQADFSYRLLLQNFEPPFNPTGGERLMLKTSFFFAPYSFEPARSQCTAVQRVDSGITRQQQPFGELLRNQWQLSWSLTNSHSDYAKEMYICTFLWTSDFHAVVKVTQVTEEDINFASCVQQIREIQARTIQTALSALLYINTAHISLWFSKDLVQNVCVCVCLNDYESESSGKKSGHTRSVQNIIGTVTNPQRISNSAFLDMVHVIACGKDGCRNDLPLPPTKIQGNENIIDLCGENDIFAEPFTSGTALSKNHSKLRWMKSLIRYERSRWMLRGAYGEDSKTEAVRQGIL